MNDLPDFNPTGTATRTVADWAAYEGTNKIFLGQNAAAGYNTATTTDYVVPASKVLYILSYSGWVFANAAADYDHFLYMFARLSDNAVVKTARGGLGGLSVVLPTPLTIAAGRTFTYAAVNYSNITCTVGISVYGYEV